VVLRYIGMAPGPVTLFMTSSRGITLDEYDSSYRSFTSRSLDEFILFPNPGNSSPGSGNACGLYVSDS